MFNKFLILNEKHLRESEIDKIIEFSGKNKFYKILSLAVALKAGIKIPTTALLLNKNGNNFEEIYNFLGLPLMIRVEYRSLPNKKILGGIPIYSKKTVENLSSFLFKKTYFPIFHPNIERSKDEYSAGILIEPNNMEIFVEIVGRGFDASTLRLGKGTPHEQFKIVLPAFKVGDKRIITSEDYLLERKKQLVRIREIDEYIKYVNEESILLNSLNGLKTLDVSSHSPPVEYLPLPLELEKELIEICRLIHSKVIHLLPQSKSFVASLSYVKEKGWVLWDIYGGWYYR